MPDLSVCFVMSRLPLGESGVLVGGCATNCVCLAQELKHQGVDIEIISTMLESDLKNLKDHPLAELVSVASIKGSGMIFKGIASILALRTKLKERDRKKNFNIVHSHSGTYPYAMTALSANKNKSARFHSLYCPLGIKGGVYSSWWERPIVASNLFNRLDRTIAVTPNVLQSLEQSGVKKEKLALNRMGVNTRRFQPIENITTNKYFPENSTAIKILCIGNGSHEKGLFELLQAIHILRKQNVEINLVATIENASRVAEYTAGEERAKKYVTQNGLTNNVRFLKLVERIEDLYAESDIVVVPWNSSRGPSDYPMVILEALAMARCAVSTPVGGSQELLRHGKAGFLSKDFSSQAIADALLDAINNEDQRGNKIKIGQQVAKEFSIIESAKQMIEMYSTQLERIRS